MGFGPVQAVNYLKSVEAAVRLSIEAWRTRSRAQRGVRFERTILLIRVAVTRLLTEAK